MAISIIDSSYLSYKSYFAFASNHLSVVRDGEEIITSAIFGFVRELLSLTDYGYQTIICVWDTPPYYKKDKIQTYKEKRKKDIPSLANEREMIKGILYNLNIPSLYAKTYEGEDVASYIINKMGHNREIHFYTNDKDCYALLDNNVQLINTVFNRKLKRSELTYFSIEDLEKEFGVTPKQFSEMKTIMGCASDNVQGVVGIGPKKASDLISHYKTVRNVYFNLDQLKPKLAEKLINAKNDGSLNESKFLTTIVPPPKVELFVPKIKLSFEQILGYIEAYSLLKGANKLQLVKLRERNKSRIEELQRILKW